MTGLFQHVHRASFNSSRPEAIRLPIIKNTSAMSSASFSFLAGMEADQRIDNDHGMYLGQEIQQS
jgi:hypothetical protein